MEGGVGCMARDGLKKKGPASPAIGQQPAPEVEALRRAAHGPRRAAEKGEIQKDHGVGAAQPDLDHVEGAEVAIHDPSIVGRKLLLEGCPRIVRRRDEAGLPEDLVELDDRQACPGAEAPGESRFAGCAPPEDDHALHMG